MSIPFTIKQNLKLNNSFGINNLIPNEFSYIISQGDHHIGCKCSDSIVNDVLNNIKNTVYLHTFNKDLFHTVCAYDDLNILLKPIIIQLLVDSIIIDYILIFSSTKYTFSLLKN